LKAFPNVGSYVLLYVYGIFLSGNAPPQSASQPADQLSLPTNIHQFVSMPAGQCATSCGSLLCISFSLIRRVS